MANDFIVLEKSGTVYVEGKVRIVDKYLVDVKKLDDKSYLP